MTPPADTDARPAGHLGRPARCEGDGGAVVVELVMLLPILVAFICAIVDFGMAYRDRQTIQGSLRNAARVAAASNSYGQFKGADRYTLTTLQAGLNELLGPGRLVIERVVIFRNNPSNWSTGPTATVPDICKTTAVNNTVGAGSTTAFCNIYSATQVQKAASTVTADFVTSVNTAGTGCSTSAGWDRFWCPPTRAQNLTSNSGNGPDYLGVYIRATYTTFTGFFGRTLTLEDTFAVRIEPDVTP